MINLKWDCSSFGLCCGFSNILCPPKFYNKMKGRLFATALLNAGIASAARPCLNSPPMVQWTISEWTYDAPDPTGFGRAKTDAVVGLYLTTGQTDHSCFGQWPDGWDGWADGGETLVYFSCINNRGRMDDTTLSFAMDWKTRTMHVVHTYVCSDGSRQGYAVAFPE